MGTVVAIGTEEEVAGLSLLGVTVLTPCSDDRARSAWRSLGPDVAVVVLGLDAEHAIGSERWAPGAPLTITIPPSEGPT